MNWKDLSPKEVWDALKSAPKVAGPWQKHVHGWCDCGSRPRESSYHGEWYYRENVHGDEIITAFENDNRNSINDTLRKDGWLLVD